MKNEIKSKQFEGCKKYDCQDYPYFDNEELDNIILNSNCKMCKYFKKFNLYIKKINNKENN